MTALFGTRSRRIVVVPGVALAVLAALLWHPWPARAGGGAVRRTPTAACIAYRTTHVPAGTRCMVMPWEVTGAGPWARFIYITFPPGCFAGYPTARVAQTRRAIRIRAFGWRPAIRHGRLDLTCGGGMGVHLRSAIRGRRIRGAGWPTALHFGSLAHQLVQAPLGIPRLLGLSPAQAKRVLWLFGFHSRTTGRGRQIVGQLPGWGLVGKDRGRPNPYDGVTKLTAGSHIKIPSAPVIPPGARTGILKGAVRFEGGPPAPHRPPIGGVVDLFDSRGKLLAIFSVRNHHYFRLRVLPGRYLLLDDTDYSCGPTRASVHTAAITRVTVGAACDVP
jgi:hypothetical protein